MKKREEAKEGNELGKGKRTGAKEGRVWKGMDVASLASAPRSASALCTMMDESDRAFSVE